LLLKKQFDSGTFGIKKQFDSGTFGIQEAGLAGYVPAEPHAAGIQPS
jgi:hypothetical protein